MTRSDRKTCDICDEENLEEYVDGQTIPGRWANMCMECHRDYGTGIGTGLGQHYKLFDGKYRKVAG